MYQSFMEPNPGPSDGITFDTLGAMVPKNTEFDGMDKNILYFYST